MSVVEYVVRDAAGSVQRGSFPEGDPATIYVSYSKDISLNLSPAAVGSYERHGADLLVVLESGQVLVLSGYFDDGATGGKSLFLSQQGDFIEVALEDAREGVLTAGYEVVDVSGKWSAYDEMVFLDLDRVEPVIAPLAGPLLSPLGLLGGGAALAAGGVVLAGGGGGDDGPGGGGTVIQPTVDDPDATHLIGGSGPDTATVSGTGAPGSTVVVTIGDQTQTVTVDDDGRWTANFDPQTLPGDGVYPTTVEVTDPDGNEFDLSGPTVDIDTTPPDLEVQSGTESTGDLLNGAEHPDGATITGVGEAGATVAITIEGTTHTTTVADDGTWSVTFATGEIRTGEYSTGVSITTTDARGNSATFSDVLVVDTVAPVADLDTVEGDDVISASETSDGVTLSGTGEPGATVSVEFQNVVRMATVGADGTWSVDYSASEIVTGTYDSKISITTTDVAGNSSTSVHGVHVDTEQAVTLNTQVGDDHTVNAAEQAAGITLTGTAEAGSSVVVTMGGVSHTVAAAADGTWSADFSSAEIPAGTYDATVDVTATDAAGNASSTSGTVRVDTENAVALNPGQAGGDDLLNGAEAASGTTLTGTAEPGASVAVTFQGITRTVTADASGNWSAAYTAAEITPGEYDAPVSITSTDAAGNSATATGTVRVDTVTDVSIAPGQAGGDDIVNAAEAQSGVTFTGAAEPGSSVLVTVAGVTRTATVDGNGNWSAVFGSGALPAGEYDTTISVSSTDSVGNTATTSSSIRVDTNAGEVALSPLPIEIDDVINAVERSDGVVINGTATPGLTVTVTLGAATQQVVADANGTWSTTFPAADIPTGTQPLPITASIVDDAGNQSSVSDSVMLDTEVLNFTGNTGAIEGDNVINAAERADGVTLNGTVEAGSTVMVQLGAATQAASVDALGNWQVNFSAGSIPQGTYDSAVKVTATDPAGNVEVIQDSVRVDTELTLTTDPDQTADDVLNAVERASGVTLTGASEPGSTVTVQMRGITRSATVDANGNWSAAFTAAELPEGTYTETATVTATDQSGNVATATETFNVDTEIDTPAVDSVTFVGQDVWRIGTQGSIDSYTVNTLETNGNVGSPDSTQSSHPFFGTEFTFQQPVANGTNLVVSREDAAGNEASTLVVLKDNATSIDHAGLTGFDIQALNLDYGDDANLTLTEAQIRALSDSTDTLTVHGGADDTLNVTGATLTGETRQIDGSTYDVYTLGDDGTTLVIEQDITVII